MGNEKKVIPPINLFFNFIILAITISPMAEKHIPNKIKQRIILNVPKLFLHNKMQPLSLKN